MNAHWRIELLGRLRVVRGDRVITRFRTRKTGELLACLALYQEHSHPREGLIERLWPGCELTAGRKHLRWTLAHLRRLLEPPDVQPAGVLLADRQALRLNPAACVTDVGQFEELLRNAARASAASECVVRLTEAVSLYRGEFLPGCFEPWVLQERQRLQQAYLQALEQLVGLLEQQSDLSHALRWARRAVATDPLWEQAQGDLIRLLAAAGQPAAAIRQYQELEKLLSDELGTRPAPEIRSLVRDIERRAGQSTDTAAGGPIYAPPSEWTAETSARSTLPIGTVAFLLIETLISPAQDGSAGGEAAPSQAFALEPLSSLLREHGGHLLASGGDTLRLLFAEASTALAAAVAAQTAAVGNAGPRAADETESSWDSMPDALPSDLRMALHLGELASGEALHANPAFQHAMRLLLAAHPGQILLSQAAAAVLQDDPPPGVDLFDLGRYRLHRDSAPERLFQATGPDMQPRRFPPPQALPSDVSNLPLQFTRFFGREEEIARLTDLLAPRAPAACRLVTLTGAGGSGKTRLALEAAARLREAFGNAVWFAPLLDLSNADQILDAVLAALGLPRSPSAEPFVQVTSALSTQASLLLLDNFEHLVAKGAPLVRALLDCVPSLICLVTSREKLALEAEQEFPVAPLPVPVTGSVQPMDSSTGEMSSLMRTFASVQLFVDRAQSVRPDFQLTRANALAVADLCGQLEGIPLAIELAAARASALTPAQMLGQIRNRFDLLVSRRRDALPRHRSLRAALDWSYQLLPPNLQRFFARLSIFRGGWTVAAAVMVCQESAAQEYLERLCECSLVVADLDGEETRFQLLETLREYGDERLASSERAGLERRHAEFHLALAEEAQLHPVGASQKAWFDKIAAEHDNLRAALDWSCRSPTESGGRPRAGCAVDGTPGLAGARAPEIGLRIATALCSFWALKGYCSEGRERFAVLLGLAEASVSSALRGAALRGAATLTLGQADYEAARLLAQESLTIAREAGDRIATAHSLTILGQVGHAQANFAVARSYSEEGLSIFRALGHPRGIADALASLGLIAQGEGHLPVARVHYEECLPILREVADNRGVADVLYHLGDLARRRGELTAGQSMLEECLGLWRELESRPGIGSALNRLGLIAHQRGDHQTARTLLTESLCLRRELGEKYGVAECLHLLGRVSEAQGDLASARSLLEEALAGYRGIGYKEGIVGALGTLCDIACDQHDLLAARSYVDEAIGIAAETGSWWSQAEALQRLGRVARREGDLDAAGIHFRKGLRLFDQMQHAAGRMSCLYELARIAGGLGQPGRAARLFGATASLRGSTGPPFSTSEQSRFDQHVCAVRSAMSESAFALAWARGQAMSLDAAVDYALNRKTRSRPGPVAGGP